MPMVTTEKQCAWCGNTWKPTKPKARTCSPSCRALLTQSEKYPDRPRPVKPDPVAVHGFDFLDDDDFVTSVEAAALLATTRQTVANWIEAGRLKAGEGPRHGRGHLIQVRVGDVRWLMKQHGKRLRGASDVE